MPRLGQAKAIIDLAELEKLAGLNCTDEEIAAWFNVSQKTIQRHKKGAEFANTLERGRAKGRVSIRREQFSLLKKGNATMGIWLGKQLLGQRDFDREARLLTPDAPTTEIKYGWVEAPKKPETAETTPVRDKQQQDKPKTSVQ